MSIEEIIRRWKTDAGEQESDSTANPVGEELTDKELQEAFGSNCINLFTCANAWTCQNGITFCVKAPTA